MKITWPCFTLPFVLFSALLSASADPTDPSIEVKLKSLKAAWELPKMLGEAANPECTFEDYLLMETYLDIVSAGEIGACLLTVKTPHHDGCPPGGLKELIQKYPQEFAMVKDMMANCGKSNSPGSTSSTSSTPPK